MNLKEKILNDRMDAMKFSDQSTKNSLSTVIGELDRISKNPTEEQVIKVIKKMAEGCRECNNISEAELFEKYLPKMISEEEMNYSLLKFIDSNSETKSTDIGKFMGYMKTNFSGKYDGKMASELFKKHFETK